MNKKTNKKPVDTVKTLQVNDVVNEIGNLQVSIQSTLANISGNITNKLAELHNTEEVITSLEDRLNELYLIEKEALSLEEMRKARNEENEKYQKMIAARDTEWSEEEADRAKAWQRAEEEYKYEIAQKQKKFIDEFNAEVEAHKRAERVRTLDLNQSWTVRENELKAREAEFNDYKKQVTEFPTVLKTELAKAEAIVGNSMKKQFEHQLELAKKDMEAAKNMSESRIQALQIQVGQMVDQIKELNVQLYESRKDAKDVTAQALQSASGRQVAEALQRVVDSKDNGKSK